MKNNSDNYTMMILIALISVVVCGMIGIYLAKEMTVQILGFCTLICITLLNLLESKKAASKAELVAEKVEEVRHATNSLTDRLVAATEKEAFQRGGDEEKAKINNKV